MASMRKNIYFNNQVVINEILKQKNYSKYVEDCVLFYIENHDIIRKYINSMTNLSDAIAKK